MMIRAQYWLWIGLLLAMTGCNKQQETPQADRPSAEATPTFSAELTGESSVILTATSPDGVTRTKTIPVPAGTSVEVCEYRDDWLVATLHVNPSTNYYAAWNTATDAIATSPGHTWLGRYEHFITINAVHFSPPDDPERNLFFYVDGHQAPLLDTIPYGEDGTRGYFSMELSSGPRGEKVYRISFPQEYMWDSSLFLYVGLDGQWHVLGLNERDCGGRITVNYGWETESIYTVAWLPGGPVVHVEQTDTDWDRPESNAEEMTETTTRNTGVLIGDGVAYHSPAE
jgi:hypothetical protein